MKLTLFLILINVGIFLYILPNLTYFGQNYGVSYQSFLEGKYYIIITAMFIHSSLTHVAGNMLVLFFIGSILEKVVSKSLYIFTYFFSGILANLFIVLMGYIGISVLAVGASAAISALIGLGAFRGGGKWAFSTFGFIPIPMPLMVAGALYFLMNIYGILLAHTLIASLGHLVGILTGSLIGLKGQRHKLKKIIIFILIAVFISLLPYLFRYVIGLWNSKT